MLRDYQTAALSRVEKFFSAREPALLLSSPTGTGKTVMQVEVLKQFPNGIQTAPNEEILDVFRSMGAPEESLWTIKKLKNRLSEAAVDPSQFTYWRCDEAHHSSDDTHQTVNEFLGRLPRLGWTATTYRGTPRETAKLLNLYARNVYQVLSIPDAISRNAMAKPEFRVCPLVDDETIEVSNGEFTAAKVEGKTREKLEDLVHLIGDSWKEKATMVALTTRDLVSRFVALCSDNGITAKAVTGETKYEDRVDAFSSVQERRCLLVQIAVVSEGVNLPGLRRLVDARPTMSPVFWMQLVGRVTRPGPVVPEVWVCNHNLLRHGYLFQGVIPRAEFDQAIRAWGPDWKPSRRMVARAIGLDGLGKFQPAQVPTKSGSFVWAFILGKDDTQYAAILRPEGERPVVCAKRTFLVENGKRRYDLRPQWQVIDCLPDMQGGTSVPAQAVSDKQLDWWKKSAGSRGLNPDVVPDARQFQVLPLLLQTKKVLS